MLKAIEAKITALSIWRAFHVGELNLRRFKLLDVIGIKNSAPILPFFHGSQTEWTQRNARQAFRIFSVPQNGAVPNRANRKICQISFASRYKFTQNLFLDRCQETT